MVDASTIACVGVSGYLIGLALPVSPRVDLPLAFLVLLAITAAFVGLHQQPRAPRSLVTIPMLAFVATRLASALAAPEASRSLHVVAPLLPAFLLFFLLSEWVQARHHVVAIYLSLTGAGLVLATTFLVGAGLSGAASPDIWALPASSPLIVVKNDLAVVAVLAPLALAAALVRPRALVRVLVAGFFAALLAVIGVSQSRTALVTAVVALLCFVAFTRGRALGGPTRIWLTIAGAAASLVALDALLGFRLAQKVGDWQGGGRLALWAAALGMFQDAPVLGHGPHGFVLHYRAYLDALQLPAWVLVDTRLTPWAHNLYLELLAEQGLLGLAAFLALIAAGAVMLGRIRRTRQKDLQCLGAGAGAALVGFLAAAFIELSLLRAWVTIVLFTLLGLLATITRVQHEGRA